MSVKQLLFTMLTLTFAIHAAPAGEPNYLVVSLLNKGDPFEKAGAKLVRLRKGAGIRATVGELESILGRLRRLRPKYVAFIARPEQVNVNLARRLFRLATEVDDDPFVDFSYGVITGRTPEVAVRLAKSGVQTEAKRRKPNLGILGVADGKMQTASATHEQFVPLRNGMLPLSWATVVDSDGNRDGEFIEETLKQFQSKSLLAFAGHGIPSRVVGGPTHIDLEGHRFTGTIAYNIACYTGVTSDWFEFDHPSAKVRKRRISIEESFCLSMLDTGVAGYVAYSCPRPAGPEMFADMLSLATEGISVGEQRRRHANSVILTHLSQEYGDTGFETLVDEQDTGSPQSTDEIVRNMSTGSLLFGDPATVPFRNNEKAYPVVAKTQRNDDTMSVNVSIDGPLWHWFCSDQLEQSCMKIEANIPFDGNGVGAVSVDQLPFGEEYPARKITAALESHEGKSVLHLKATFKRPAPADLTKFARGVSASFTVTLDDAKMRDSFLYVAASK